LPVIESSAAVSIGAGVVNKPLRMLLAGTVLLPTGFLAAGLRIE
jgi:hypothetical protein